MSNDFVFGNQQMVDLTMTSQCFSPVFLLSTMLCGYLLNSSSIYFIFNFNIHFTTHKRCALIKAWRIVARIKIKAFYSF